MNERLPLSALLSQALVAFTIEFDNEAERRMPHRTTDHGATTDTPHAPWLVSLAMWENCMRHAGEEGVKVRALEELARTTTNLNGMQRWGYVVAAPDPADTRAKRPLRDWLVRPTRAGRKAQEIWRPLAGEIGERWRQRFGAEEIGRLREALWRLVRQFDFALPDCLPILGYGLFTRGPGGERAAAGRPKDEDGARLPLSALLSRALLAFAMEYERESELSLAMSANVVRVLDEKGVRARDLPRLTGVAKELLQNSVGYLAKRRYVVIERDPKAKAEKRVRLTAKGRAAQDDYRRRLGEIEERWQVRFGEKSIDDLRAALEHLVSGPPGEPSPLFLGLKPHPEGWRAALPAPEVLPHYPMVTHRGGYPDGS